MKEYLILLLLHFDEWIRQNEPGEAGDEVFVSVGPHAC